MRRKEILWWITATFWATATIIAGLWFAWRILGWLVSRNG